MGVEDDGFTDSSCSYTLNTFATYANRFKREKFGMEPAVSEEKLVCIV